MNTNVKVIFNRANRLDTNGCGLVQLRIPTTTGRYKFISTGTKVKADDWNENKSRVRSSNPFHDIYNKQIVEAIRNAMLYGDVQDCSVTAQSFNEYYKMKCDGDSRIGVESRRNQMHTYDHLCKFNPQISFKDISQQMMNNFELYLNTVGLKNNTIVKHLKNVKKYINCAVDDRLIRRDIADSAKVKVKYERTKFVFLTLDEIDKIAELKCTGSMRKTQMAFLMSCYTGFRHSDMQKLHGDMFHTNKDGLYIYLDKMKKIDRDVYLPLYKHLNGRGQRLAEKLLEESDGLLFPMFNNQKANYNLKMIAIAAGINKHLTFHVARKSFATNLAAETKDVFKVMLYMGISDPNVAMTYIQYGSIL